MRAIPLALATAALALVPFGDGARAQGPCGLDIDHPRCVTVVIDHLTRLSLERPVRTVLIGNPAIAEITMLTDTRAVLSARSIGTTNLLFLDEAGETIGDYEILVREGDMRRVVMRRGPSEMALYQCAPRCERTLTQLDSVGAFEEAATKIARENQMNAGAAGDAASTETAAVGGGAPQTAE